MNNMCSNNNNICPCNNQCQPIVCCNNICYSQDILRVSGRGILPPPPIFPLQSVDFQNNSYISYSTDSTVVKFLVNGSYRMNILSTYQVSVLSSKNVTLLVIKNDKEILLRDSITVSPIIGGKNERYVDFYAEAGSFVLLTKEQSDSSLTYNAHMTLAVML